MNSSLREEGHKCPFQTPEGSVPLRYACGELRFLISFILTSQEGKASSCNEGQQAVLSNPHTSEALSTNEVQCKKAPRYFVRELCFLTLILSCKIFAISLYFVQSLAICSTFKK
ncbi:hypothetical protein B6S12_03900 [Helicobacter valdiviensis]|uniref:Uncharacterized protein n=1 Tax=Helicobacter valdiviensis TaxID=1458358 RepID=A0A2W6NHY8_9HELI|nr:hypothetical protein B6S12_03900 [Helicobacter valdiviensis]